MNLKVLPDITFARRDVDEIDDNIITVVEGLLGRTLARADPLRLFLQGVEAIIVQQREIIDHAAKMNLLAYATGDYLDHIGALVGTARIEASPATVTLKMMLSATRETATVIEAGKRATAGDGVHFAINENSIIPAGETTVTIAATCTESGGIGNGYAIGEINAMTDPIPFVASVENTTVSAGGADRETDDAYRARIHDAPERFSNAGSYGAYEYFAKSASSLITDIAVENGGAGIVKVYPLLSGGTVPEQEVLTAVSKVLNDKRVRPLTDNVQVEAPKTISFDVNVKYWIAQSDVTEATEITTAVKKAVDDYILWQRSKLGRDINPTELYYRIRQAGAKRAEIIQPAYAPVSGNTVAIGNTPTVSMEGIEDD